MKKILINLFIVLALSANTLAQQPIITDTLTWLHNNIQQRSSYFSGKPLSVLLDSLYDLNTKLVEYDPPMDFRQFSDEIRHGLAANKDTVFAEDISIYFDTITGGGYVWQIHTTALENHLKYGMPMNVNTHVPYIKIIFTKPEPFLRAWWQNDTPLATNIWTNLAAQYWGQFIVQSVQTGEY